MAVILSDLQIFSGYTETELGTLEKFFKTETYDAGSYVIKPDDTVKKLFIVLDGKITGSLILPGRMNRKHTEYGRGDVFGEIPAFTDKPDFNSYSSPERSELLVIEEKDFHELMESAPEYSIKFILNLLSHTIMQLRKSSRFLADVVEWGEKASRRVITDELTGLYNRAFLDDALENFFSISQSNSKPLSFIMLDADNFRKINELVGHDSANAVLIEFAGIIKRIISKQGILARYGGDEFCILLPETDLNTAVEYAEEIRSGVENFNFSKHLNGHDIPVTTSIGISSYPETAADFESFRRKADESLYRAKECGRNIIKCIE